jgi:ABC-type nickel/cobalt efflux system permease component RcnA
MVTLIGHIKERKNLTIDNTITYLFFSFGIRFASMSIMKLAMVILLSPLIGGMIYILSTIAGLAR